ncbi:MAG: 5-deoxy-glucuronate isomerase, partial [Betaproteobacteria bacterium]
MSLLVKGKREGRDIVAVTPQSAGWTYVGFTAHRLRAGEKLRVHLPGRESCVVVMAGKASISVGTQTWRGVGNRDSVFDDAAPAAVYAPAGATIEIVAETATEIGVASAPGETNKPARLIEPSTMKRSVRGMGANTRYVCDILPQQEPADHLLVVEVRTPAGHASSYPPHKHDTD